MTKKYDDPIELALKARTEDDTEEVVETNPKYVSITDGENLPDGLPRCQEAYNYFANFKEMTHPTASLVGALATASVVGAGRVRTFTDAPVTMYLSYIAPTASSKDPVVKGLKRIDHIVNEGGTVKNGGGVQSSGALDFLLKQCTGQMVLVIDEFGDILAEITDGKNAAKGTLKAPLKTLYSVNHGDIYEGNVYSDQGGKRKVEVLDIKSLAFGIVGITTKNQLLDKLSYKHLSDGTLNRYVFIDGTNHKSRESGGYGTSDIPPSLEAHLSSFQIVGEDSVPLRLSPEALHFWKEEIPSVETERGRIWEWCQDDDTKLELAGRIRENSLRMATAISYFENFEEVPLFVLEWCFNFVMLSMQRFHDTFNNHDAEMEQKKRDIALMIEWFKKQDKGGVTKSRILQYCPVMRANAKTRNMWLAELLELGILKTDGNRFSLAKKLAKV